MKIGLGVDVFRELRGVGRRVAVFFLVFGVFGVFVASSNNRFCFFNFFNIEEDGLDLKSEGRGSIFVL